MISPTAPVAPTIATLGSTYRYLSCKKPEDIVDRGPWGVDREDFRSLQDFGSLTTLHGSWFTITMKIV
jgi:hypothetical protein